MTLTLPLTVTFRRAVPTDFSEVRRITRYAYLCVGHFAPDHPYMSVLEDVEHRAEHAQVWVTETAGKVVAAVTLTFAGEPYSEIAQDGELEFRMLAVDPEHQGGGVGRAVVREIAEHAGSCQASGRSASPAPRSWSVRIACTGRWASAGRRSGTGMCPGEDVLLWVFRLELSKSVDPSMHVVEPVGLLDSPPSKRST